MDKCENCGELIFTEDNNEKYDSYRDKYYCERCEERYLEEVIEAEGNYKMD